MDYDKFTMENTEGFSQEQLDKLNLVLESQIAGLEDLEDEHYAYNLQKYYGEQILQNYEQYL